MTVIIKKPYVTANCHLCGRTIFGRQYEMVKPRGGWPHYYCPSCIKAEKERAKR